MTYDFDTVVDRRQSDSNKWRKFGPDVTPLWVADMDFRSPEPVVRALRERVEHGIYGYLWPENLELHELIVDRLSKRYGWRVGPEAVVPLPGVIPGFNVACRALSEPSDGVLVQTPLYPPLLRVAGNLGLTRDEVELTRLDHGRYVIDFDRFRTAITPRTRIFLLCNPHNPVGRTWDREELEHMAEICGARGLAVVADEIHGDLVYPGRAHVAFASLAPEIAERTITLMAPSKTFNLPGLKCSVAVIPNAQLRERFAAARADFVQGVNVLGHTAAVAAYREGQEWLDALLRYLEANREYLMDFVRAHLPGVSVAPPEATYLGWLDCRQAGLSDDPFTFFLERARVALNDGRLFGQGGHGFVRLNFACPRPVLRQGLDRMREALAAARS